MSRIDVHNHLLPGIDDGCRDMAESLECLKAMVAHGYSRLFCTPHRGTPEYDALTNQSVAADVVKLRARIAAAKIPLEIQPGGEISLQAQMPEHLKEAGIPTYGNRNKYCLVDIWESLWPAWAERAVQWLQKRNLTVIMAHPERMPPMRRDPALIDHLASLGVLFQGNLGPIAGADSPDINGLAERFLKEDRYFVLGSDTHRRDHINQRLQGLKKAVEFVGHAKVDELTITNPGKIWDA